MDLVRGEHLSRLDFVTDISLIFIALAAGGEFYLKEFSNRLRSVARMCAGQVIGVFLLSLLGVFLALDFLPFVQGFSSTYRWGIALLFASIFIARSPSTLIAIIGELRAKGPFTQMALGVTVLMDVVVIVLFTICLEFSMAMMHGASINYTFILIMLLSILLSCAIGLFLGKVISLLLSLTVSSKIKLFLLFLLAFAGHNGIHWLSASSTVLLGKEVYMESLLVFIVSGFYMVNYSPYRYEFATLLESVLDYVYVLFFTLTGLTMSVDKLISVGVIASLFFIIRFIAIFFGSVLGSVWAGESKRLTAISWMPHITQAGIALGLAKTVESKFPEWGASFSATIIALLMINQLTGPLFLKWSIQKAGESYIRNSHFTNRKQITIFGLESLSLALAHQLIKNKYKVDLVSLLPEEELQQISVQYPEVRFHSLVSIDMETISSLPLKKPEKIVLLFSDKKNKRVCECLQDKFVHTQWLVRLNNRTHLDYFHGLDALIVEPSTAMVSLFDQFVRSPLSTSLLLGMETGQGTVDVEVRNSDIFGVALRDLRLPKDIIILSIKREGQLIISHGFTRIQKGDRLTLVGDKEELEKLTVKFS